MGLNVGHCQFDPQGDYDDDLRWKKALSVHTFVTSTPATELFNDPDWPETLLYDLDVSMYFWNEVYAPLVSGRRPM